MTKYILLTLISALAACKSDPPDVWVCIQLKPDLGYCTKTLSNGELYVDNLANLYNGTQTWAQVFERSIIVPSDSWQAIKNYIQDQCVVSGCDRVKNVMKNIDKRNDARVGYYESD